MEDGVPVPGSLFIYAPNKIAPVIFALLFTVSGAVHLWQCQHYRCFKLTWLFPLCCMLFAVGFAIREFGAFNYTSLAGYITSTMFIYFSPPLLELANYHILGRVLYYVPYNSPIHPGRVLSTLGFLSTLVEVFNAIGISYATNPALPEKYITIGNIFMKTSLVLQIIVIALFYVLAAVFQYRCSRSGVNTSKVQNSLATLYLSSFIILIRTVYRTVEFFGGENLKDIHNLSEVSPLLRYEWFFWVFEASVMFINVVLWNLRHPRRYLPKDYRVYLAKDGVTELQGPGWETKNTGWKGFVITLVDPFGFLDSALQKRDGKQPFWETDGIGGTQQGKSAAGRPAHETV
ncbi:RTA1 domain protein [Thozetella sp. PMI_491]|nr:RTA1 domain protein [Thozetella sp. PMI_491]